MKKKILRGMITLAIVAMAAFPKLDAQAAIYSDPDGSLFDAEFYAATYPDVVAAIGDNEYDLCMHYITTGKAEGRYPNATLAAEALAEAQETVVTDDTIVVSDATTAESDASTDDGVYNVLAIGNSITIHPVCSYWWGSWGMAATSADKDYVHKLVAGLQQTYENVTYDVYRSGWEGSSVRNMMLPNLDETLKNDYDLVVIQLGENVSSLSTFKDDFEMLVNYVKQSEPNAQIVIVGDYWYKSGRDTIKKTVAEETGSIFVDISAIQGVSKYRSSIGTKVLGDDGKYHSIYTSDVAIHPNDQGMAYIANCILAALQ